MFSLFKKKNVWIFMQDFVIIFPTSIDGEQLADNDHTYGRFLIE